jgi:predicted transcriptional regulator
MAQELVERHGLKQDEVAGILGISQSAVSKYSNKVRGYAVEIDSVEGIHPLIAEMIVMLMSHDYERDDFLELFCRACGVIRKTGLACQFCRKSDSSLRIDECGFCLEIKSQKDGE